MPKLIQFGAGVIGRGFIAQVFSMAGWEVVFVEVSRGLLDHLLVKKSYTIWEVDSSGEAPCTVSRFRAVDGQDLDRVAHEVSEADLASTAVGLKALPFLAPGLARGLAKRSKPLDILVCENGSTAAEDLREAILQQGLAPLPPFGCVRTSIGRMAPPPREGLEPLDVRVEPYRRLPVEGAAFRGPVPEVPGLEAKPDFTLALRQKLYLHNLTHAVLAYGGLLRGLETVPDAVGHPELRALMREAAQESEEALAREHGSGEARQEAIRRESREITDDLERRYGNRALSDPLSRVARDPLRKLAGDDRLVGAARLCLKNGVQPRAIAQAIREACLFRAEPSDPSEPRWSQLQAGGWQAILAESAQLSPSEPLALLLASL